MIVIKILATILCYIYISTIGFQISYIESIASTNWVVFYLVTYMIISVASGAYLCTRWIK
jgi:hypothetical protein